MKQRPVANDTHAFLIECRMTCLGGSEMGQCDCSAPADCKMRSHPMYRHYRAEAANRAGRLANKANDNNE
jgi:hypothetical protein